MSIKFLLKRGSLVLSQRETGKFAKFSFNEAKATMRTMTDSSSKINVTLKSIELQDLSKENTVFCDLIKPSENENTDEPFLDVTLENFPTRNEEHKFDQFMTLKMKSNDLIVNKQFFEKTGIEENSKKIPHLIIFLVSFFTSAPAELLEDLQDASKFFHYINFT